MNSSVAYSLLKYKHSEKLGETLNIGILYIFPNENIVHFSFPKSLARIRRAFPDAEIDTIKSYLFSFKKKEKSLQQLSKENLFGFDELLSDVFFPSIGGSLQFDLFEYGLVIKDTECTISTYNDIYFSNYKQVTNEHKYTTASQVIKKLQNNLFKKSPTIGKLVVEKKEPLTINKINFKVDLKWENKVQHFIKALSFDTDAEENIINKALLIQNQLNYLSDKIVELNARIDLIIAKPKNQKFIDVYNYSIEILNNTDANKQIFEEENIDDYTDNIVSEAHL